MTPAVKRAIAVIECYFDETDGDPELPDTPVEVRSALRVIKAAK